MIQFELSSIRLVGTFLVVGVDNEWYLICPLFLTCHVQGRPMRVRKTPFIMDWEENRQVRVVSCHDFGLFETDHCFIRSIN